MAENSITDGSKLTTEQLLTELGKLVFAMSKQLGTVTQKLESIDGVLVEGILQKLDRIAVLLEASNGGLDAIKTAIGKGTEKIEAIDKKAEKIEKAVKADTDKCIKELSSIVASGKDLEKAITGFEEKMTAGLVATGNHLDEGLKPVEESLSALMMRTDGVIEGVNRQTEEAARLAALPPHPDLVTKLDELTDELKNSSQSIKDKYASETSRMIESPPHPDLVTKLDGLTDELRKSSENLIEKYISETTRMIGSPPHPDLVSRLESILDQAKSSSDAMNGSLSRTADGIVSAIGSSDESRKALLEDKFTTISNRMEIFPESVSQLGEKLTEKIEDFKEEAGRILEEASSSLEKSTSTLEAVEKIVEETKREQTEALGKMMELVEKHRENADETEIDRLNSLAIHHYNNSEYTHAQDSVEKALMLGANRAELWSNLAHIKAAAEDMTGAEEAFRKALQLEPELDQAVSGLGVLLVDTGRPQETIEFLREFLMEEMPSVRTMIAYGRALSATGRHSDALEIMNKAKELAPDNPEIDAEIRKYSESGSLSGLGTSVKSNTESILESGTMPGREPDTDTDAESIIEKGPGGIFDTSTEHDTKSSTESGS